MKKHSKNVSVILLICSTMLLSACSTNHEKEKREVMTTEKTADLIDTFDINKEQAEDFKESATVEIKPTSPDQKEVKVEDIKIIVETKETKPTSKKDKKTPKAETAKRDSVAKKETPAEKTETVSSAASATPAIVPQSTYPEGYPEDYKNYDLKSKSVWAKFKPAFYSGEQSVMAITYLGVTAGYITISSKGLAKIKDKTVYHYYARFKSSDAYRYFYWLDDYIESFVEKDTFLPLKYQLIQREKKQNVDDLQLFDFDKMMTYHWFKKVKDGQTKNEKIDKPIPRYAQDSFSALQFVRGLPLIKGDVYELPVVTRGKIWLLKVMVDGPETTSVDGNNVKAIKIRAETHFPGVLKKSGDIIFWYGIESERKLLKFQAKVKIGSIYGELVDYKPGILVK